MAKQGFSYYKAETDRFQDIKIKRLKKKHRCAGYAVYQYLLNEIYRVQGYCLQFTEDHLFDVSEYWDIDELQVTEIVGYCAEIGLFNARLWQEHTSTLHRHLQGMQEDTRYRRRIPAGRNGESRPTSTAFATAFPKGRTATDAYCIETRYRRSSGNSRGCT